jgi:hypothetical protein
MRRGGDFIGPDRDFMRRGGDFIGPDGDFIGRGGDFMGPDGDCIRPDGDFIRPGDDFIAPAVTSIPAAVTSISAALPSKLWKIRSRSPIRTDSTRPSCQEDTLDFAAGRRAVLNTTRSCGVNADVQ